jgi:hypothetical protein
LEALEPRSRAPRTNPTQTSGEICERVIELRVQLTADGLDAGPVTIAWYLQREGLRAPAPATISRILTRAGLVSPQPRKRPRSSYIRFQAAQPNEMWQSDFIHWRLADGSDVEVLNWLDDHSRYLLSCTAHQPVTGDDVVAVFLDLVERYGAPVSTLTDNGSVYTSRFTGGRNAFEYLLPILGVRQKNGSPVIPRHRARQSASTRPCSAGSRRAPKPARSPNSNDSSTSSERITTRSARTARLTDAHQQTPTTPHPRRSQPTTDAHKATTGCATTGSITKAR